MPYDWLYDTLATLSDKDFPDQNGTREYFFQAYEIYIANVNGSGVGRDVALKKGNALCGRPGLALVTHSHSRSGTC